MKGHKFILLEKVFINVNIPNFKNGCFLQKSPVIKIAFAFPSLSAPPL